MAKAEKFRTRPVEVSAIRFRGQEDLEDVRSFVGPRCQYVLNEHDGAEAVIVKRMQGEMRANRGDWIVKGMDGEFRPVGPDVFVRTFERVGAEPPLLAEAFAS